MKHLEHCAAGHDDEARCTCHLPDKPTHIIYHGNCYDGFGAAWAAWLCYGDSVTYIPALYGVAPPDLPRDARVVMVDVSYKRPVMEELHRNVASLFVLDHHKTAEAELVAFPNTIFDMNHSGAYLAWRYFHPTCEMPGLILYVEDHDLWRHVLPESNFFHAGLIGYPFDFKTWTWIAENLDVLKTEGKIAAKHTTQAVDLMCKQAIVREIGGYMVPVVNATLHFGTVAHRLLSLYPDAPFGVYYTDRADGKRQWGMRSDPAKFDVSAIAALYGGGGHQGAAGFETDWGGWPGVCSTCRGTNGKHASMCGNLY